MKIEEITNRKDLMIFILLELHKRNGLVKFGDFFIESGYTQGIISFRKALDDMYEKGWVTRYNEPTSRVIPELPHLQTMDLRYGIDISGIEYLSSLGLIKDKFKISENINQSSNFSINPQTNNINANNNKPLSKNWIIKFWKLISENKLISSIILVIFIYLIKIIFGIDLKN
ncbi:MAG: hypothetical protein WBA61_00180 [Aequorivita sp.]